MNNPDWFLIIRQWKRSMGDVGVTLPFLVGALRRKAGTAAEDVTSSAVLDMIINQPVHGYVTEISRCPNISAPVLSVARIDDKKNRIAVKSSFMSDFSGIESLVLSINIHSNQGLNCSDKNECLRKLIESSDELINNGQYSRIKIKDKPGEYEYGDFSDREIKFIESTIMVYGDR